MTELELPAVERPGEADLDAMTFGRALHEWARRHGALAFREVAPAAEVMPLERIFDTDADSAKRISQALHRLKITAITADGENGTVSVLCKNAISSQIDKKLPKRVHEIDITYTGKTTVEVNPPAIPFSGSAGSPVWFSQRVSEILCNRLMSDTVAENWRHHEQDAPHHYRRTAGSASGQLS
ncbi:hypothetical protein KZ843_05480, partial [Pseudomonas aeruginosa]|nr:hypothetical protein [Pseudomonas aeruginosa]